MDHRRHLSTGLLVLLAAAGADAARVVETATTEVTVYPRGARVTRTGGLSLPQGESTVALRGLPASVDEGSLRLKVSGPKGTRLFGVHLRRAFTAEVVQEKIREVSAKIQELEDAKAELSDAIAARQAETEILAALAKGAAEKAGASGKAGAIADLASGTRAVGARIAEIKAANRRDGRAQRELEKELVALRAELQRLGSGTREQKTAEADLEAGAAGRVEFELSYMTSSAGWAPLYDLRLESDRAEPELALSHAAQVWQSSGEDWDDVALVLSTAHPARVTQVPDPTNWWLDFYQPRPMRKVSRARDRAAAAPAAMEQPMEAAEPALEPVPYQGAEVVQSAHATAFAIKRRTTVPSDGDRHRVGIAESRHDVDLLLVAVPRLAPGAFVEANVKYGGEEPLLPGPANLFRGADFVGKIALEPVAPGETFPVGFGKDERVNVARKLLTKKSGEEGWVWKQGHRAYRWVTTVENYAPGTREIEVREQLPRSRRKEIEVTVDRMDPKPLPDKASAPGLKRWRLKLEPKAKATITFAYSVRYPKDKRVTGME